MRSFEMAKEIIAGIAGAEGKSTTMASISSLH
jgi:hypothetical protein